MRKGIIISNENYCREDGTQRKRFYGRDNIP